MKYCEEYAALLDLFVDGELSLEEMVQVQEHLDVCPVCQSYVDDALAMRAAFPDAEGTELPDGFAAGVMAAIQADSAARAAVHKKKKKTPWVGVLASLAACCAIVILQQNGPLSARNESASVSCDTADVATAYDDAMPETAYSMTEETAEEEAVEEPAALERYGDAENQSAGSVVLTEDAADTAAAEADPAEDFSAAKAADGWVEYGNVVFACVVYLPQDRVGNVLDGYEGKPYSNANLPEDGIIGIGYALEQADFERILYDEFDYLHGPMLNQDRTTDLCCIVVTE